MYGRPGGLAARGGPAGDRVVRGVPHRALPQLHIDAQLSQTQRDASSAGGTLRPLDGTASSVGGYADQVSLGLLTDVSRASNAAGPAAADAGTLAVQTRHLRRRPGRRWTRNAGLPAPATTVTLSRRPDQKSGGEQRHARSRLGRAVQQADGTAKCRLQIPLGHPAATWYEADGTAFEMEREIEFIAGPGVTSLRTIDPRTQRPIIVGANLLEVSETNPLIHVGSMNLSSTLRQAARRFDAEVKAVPADDTPRTETGEAAKAAETAEGGDETTRHEPRQASLL